MFWRDASSSDMIIALRLWIVCLMLPGSLAQDGQGAAGLTEEVSVCVCGGGYLRVGGLSACFDSL